MGVYDDKKRLRVNRTRALGAILVICSALATVPAPAASTTTPTSPASTAAAQSAVTGRSTIPAGERRLTVQLTVDLRAGSTVTANPLGASDRRSALVRRVRPNARSDQFTIVLDRAAPQGGLPVTWAVTGLVAESTATSSGDGWFDSWGFPLSLLGLAVVPALLAYLYAVWQRTRRRGASHDFGVELAAFLKVAALITLAVIAFAAILPVSGPSSENLSALFTLLGTLAGYLAGTRPSIEEAPTRLVPQGGAPDGGTSGGPQAQGGPPSSGSTALGVALGTTPLSTSVVRKRLL